MESWRERHAKYNAARAAFKARYGFSARIINALLNMGVTADSDLKSWVAANSHRLHEISNLGEKSIRELYDAVGIKQTSAPRSKMATIKHEVADWSAGRKAAEDCMAAIEKALLS